MRNRYSKTQIGQILIQNGWLTPSELDVALQEQKDKGVRLGSVLVEKGILERGQLSRALAMQRREIPEVPASDLQNIDSVVARWVPETIARRFNLIALAKDDNDILTVAMEEPTNLATLDLLSHVTGCRIDSVQGPPAEIASAQQYSDDHDHNQP